jgi:uncharacterized protein (DUF1800 family)
MTELDTIDPEWAWSPFSPATSDDWTRRHAAHLYRRAGIAADSRQLDQAVALSPGEVVHDLLWESAESAEYQAEISALARTALAGGDVHSLPAWWTYRLLSTPDQLREKMTLFWHSHFATSGEKVTDARLMQQQNNLLREHALGDFAELVHRISQDPAMLLYLDSATNRKAHPNENYAREVMELFALGEGHYTEQDVRELARCFTGWEVRRGRFRFNRYQHDGGSKSLLGESGNFAGEDGVDAVLKQEAAPYFVVSKLVRYFVFDEPAASRELIEPLARTFREDGLALQPLVERILGSNLFFSSHAIGRKVRSPVEFAVGSLRALSASCNVYRLAEGLRDLGQHLFFPPNVKGWDGGRTWINSSTLLARANLMRELLDREETRFDRASLNELIERQGLESSNEILDWMQELLLAVEIPTEVRQHLVRELESGSDPEQRLRNTVHLLTTLPEYQLA